MHCKKKQQIIKYYLKRNIETEKKLNPRIDITASTTTIFPMSLTVSDHMTIFCFTIRDTTAAFTVV